MKQKHWLLLVTLLTLSGCSNTPSTTESSSETPTSSTTTQTTTATIDNSEQPADLSRGLTVVVNKKHPLPADYNPGENPEAGQQIRALIRDMQQQFAINNAYSGFRNYNYQQTLYQNYVATDGKEKADTYSARPGYSEHQTGLAFDILNSSGELLGTTAGEEAAVHWLHTHAHEYGFILRFPEGKEEITGYQYEPWHMRYVGDIASEIYRSGKTLEEFYNVSGGDYAE